MYICHRWSKTQHLLSLDGAQERLHLFKADLLEEGSFDSVVDGCDGVFHTASPVALEAINPQVQPTPLPFLYLHWANFISLFFFRVQAELIDPALEGTINVLRSCSKVPSVKRVVVTSFLASVLFTEEPLTPEVLIDESWFSDPVLCKESKVCIWTYFLSHTIFFACFMKYFTGFCTGSSTRSSSTETISNQMSLFEFLIAMVCAFKDLSWGGRLEVFKGEWDWHGHDKSRMGDWSSLNLSAEQVLNLINGTLQQNVF